MTVVMQGYLEIQTQNWREYLVSEDQRQQDDAENSMHTASNLFQDNLSSMMIKKDIGDDSNFDEQLVSICKEIAENMKDKDNMERLKRHLKGGFDTTMGDFKDSDLDDLRSLIEVMIETSTSQPSLVIDDFAKV